VDRLPLCPPRIKRRILPQIVAEIKIEPSRRTVKVLTVKVAIDLAISVRIVIISLIQTSIIVDAGKKDKDLKLLWKSRSDGTDLQMDVPGMPATPSPCRRNVTDNDAW
jgi:hypothetical protein